MSEQNRSLYLKYADSLRHSNDFSKAISEFFDPKANINVVHPFNYCPLYKSPSPRDRT